VKTNFFKTLSFVFGLELYVKVLFFVSLEELFECLIRDFAIFILFLVKVLKLLFFS